MGQNSKPFQQPLRSFFLMVLKTARKLWLFLYPIYCDILGLWKCEIWMKFIFFFQPSSKVFTLYFSGRTPGEYTTSLTTMRVDAQGNPIRQKREASDEEGLGISPSRVQPIQATRAPVTSVQDILNEEDIMEYLQGIADLNEISG